MGLGLGPGPGPGPVPGPVPGPGPGPKQYNSTIQACHLNNLQLNTINTMFHLSSPDR